MTTAFDTNRLPTPRAAPAGRSKGSALTRQRRRAALIFLAPMVIVLALVAGWPLARTIYFSFTDATLYDLEYHEFIGFLNFYYLAIDPQWWRAVWNTVFFAVVSVSIETILGMVIALTLNAHMPGRGLLRAAMLIPWAIPTVVSAQMWGWMYHDLYGVINEIFLGIGLIDRPLQILNTDVAVYIGVVYSYLPFMILPLYANLVKHDPSLLEAASDLGARNLTSFWKITVPLSKNGIIAGSMLVFIPVVGEFVIPELLGGPETLMIGKVLWQEFFNNRDWPVASALAVVMLAILLVPIILFNRNQAKALEGKL